MSDYELYKYIINLSYDELNREYPIDEIYIDRELKNVTVNNIFEIITDGHLMNIEQKIINWNNCYIFVRYNYIYMINYKKRLDYSTYNEHHAYEYWCKKYIEETIKGLQNLYDKSIHIINAIYNLNCKEKVGFNKNVIAELKKIDENEYNVLKEIDDEYCNLINNNRNNIEHNSSDLFPKIEYTEKEYVLDFDAKLTVKEALEKISKILIILKKERDFIRKVLSKKFKNKFDSLFSLHKVD